MAAHRPGGCGKHLCWLAACKIKFNGKKRLSINKPQVLVVAPVVVVWPKTCLIPGSCWRRSSMRSSRIWMSGSGGC